MQYRSRQICLKMKIKLWLPKTESTGHKHARQNNRVPKSTNRKKWYYVRIGSSIFGYVGKLFGVGNKLKGEGGLLFGGIKYT